MPTNQKIKKTVQKTQVQFAQRHVPIIQNIQKIVQGPQVVQTQCRSPRRSIRLLRYHKDSSQDPEDC